MKIAIIRPDCNVLSLGFYNSQELGLANSLVDLGVSVDVYYAGNVDEVTCSTIKTAGDAHVTLIQLPFFEFPLIGQGYYPSLTKELSKRKYDLLQVNEYNDIINFAALRQAKKQNIPTIIYQGMYKNLTGRINRLYTKIHDALMLPYMIKHSYYTYSKTASAANFLRSKGFEKCGVLPIGLDPSPFNTDSDVSAKYDKSILGIPDDHKIATYIGIFEPRRNIELLLEIANGMKKDKVSFVFVGVGEQLELAQEYCKKHELNNVHLLGKVPQTEIKGIYNLSDVFLLASTYEIYGMVLIEAMYFGLAVITNKTAGSDSLISHDENGIIVEPLEAKVWVEQIRSLCNNEEKLIALKNNAKQKIDSELLWDKVALQYKTQILDPLKKEQTC